MRPILGSNIDNNVKGKKQNNNNHILYKMFRAKLHRLDQINFTTIRPVPVREPEERT